ncbi:MAG: rhomboid family intramembrane serine protease [Gloeomargarita sp. SKYBB_i_bin120]|nr:rhomboid family intramembrane serine protease [Gloeomargarita sp. SKYB120]MDW8178996.1 rhomboid family intramembrane serine protease [Gloeomargarita sp. SKYBB_i_bin120]
MFPLYDDNPTQRTPVITYGLIAACVVIFFYQVNLDGEQLQQFVQAWAVIPKELFTNFDAKAMTLISSQFLHGGFWHLFGNMWFLWLFGNNLEDALGRWRFLLFYLFCGAVAALAYALVVPMSTIPLLGASGAIAGVMGGYIVRFPQAQIRTLLVLVIFVTIVRMPAAVFLGAWILMETLRAASVHPGMPGVAYLAHVAGFLTGAVLVPLLPQRLD